MGARAGLAAVFLAIAGALVGWYFLQPGTMSPQDDEDHVYCLAPAHLDGLVSAAVSLGLTGQARDPELAGQAGDPEKVVVGGRTLTVTQWRSERHADFERACTAYAAASVPAQPAASSAAANEIQQVLASLLSVIGGAMLAIFATDVKDAADRRRRHATELRTTWDAFRAAADDFVTTAMQPGGSLPATGELDVKRPALVTSLQNASRGRRRLLVAGKRQVSPEADQVLGELTGMLGAGIGYGWGAPGTQDAERGRRLKDLLKTDGDLIAKVVAGLERKK
jgi:hypothetical protein